MEKTRKILADNLRRLMASHPDADGKVQSQSALSRLSGVDQSYIGKLLRGDFAATVDKLDELAKAYDLQAWQLIVPDLEPDNPPVNHITAAEKRLYARWREIAKEVMEDPKPYG